MAGSIEGADVREEHRRVPERGATDRLLRTVRDVFHPDAEKDAAYVEALRARLEGR